MLLGDVGEPIRDGDSSHLAEPRVRAARRKVSFPNSFVTVDGGWFLLEPWKVFALDELAQPDSGRACAFSPSVLVG